MKYKSVIYDGKKYPVIYNRADKLLLYSTDKNDFDAFKFKYSDSNVLTKEVNQSEVKELKEEIEINFLSSEFLRNNIFFVFNKSISPVSIPLLISVDNNIYGICIIAKSKHPGLFYKDKNSIIYEPGYYFIFDLVTSEIVKYGIYTKKILNRIKNVYNIGKIEDMFCFGNEINSEWDNQINQEFDEIRKDYISSGKIDMEHYKKYIDLFYSYYPEASKYNKDTIVY